MAECLILGSNALNPEILRDFLKSAKVSSDFTGLTSLKGGANNCVFRIDFLDSKPLVLKSYFQNSQDQRPRLRAEFEFLKYAWEEGIRSIPQPLYQDPVQNLALYTFLEGDPPSLVHANTPFVDKAVSFLIHLNKNRKRGNHLLKASEACLEPGDYFKTVEKRLDYLQKVPQETAAEKKLHFLVTKKILPRWKQVKKEACKAALHLLIPTPEDQIITPSDFGLHNALISPNGMFYFIDFEYAGWDDPAKTICDFFLQPKIPISFASFDSFADRIASLSLNQRKTLERTKKMLPVCKIKWCCIILNVFLQTGKQRREFSKSDFASSQEKQLEIAWLYLEKHLS